MTRALLARGPRRCIFLPDCSGAPPVEPVGHAHLKESGSRRRVSPWTGPEYGHIQYRPLQSANFNTIFHYSRIIVKAFLLNSFHLHDLAVVDDYRDLAEPQSAQGILNEFEGIRLSLTGRARMRAFALFHRFVRHR